VYKHLGIKFEDTGKNNYGPYAEGGPNGAIMHYTASNASYHPKKRPYGRMPVLLPRFARGSKQKVGVQFIIFDKLHDGLKELRDRYPALKDMAADVIFTGDDLTFWHAGWANKWSYGIEFRNIGQIQKDSRGNFFWHRGKIKYVGREPIKIGKGYWEPYTRAQMATGLWVNRAMCACHGILPHRFLGHTHVSNTRIDPGPHFPIHEMRAYSYDPNLVDIPLDMVPFLREFDDDLDVDKREDPLVSEEELHLGMYRHDWDGVPDDWNGVFEDAPASEELGNTANLQNYVQQLRSLGYHVDGESLDDVVAIFRTRWKKRQGRRWVQMIPTKGGMDKEALRLLTVMIRQWDNL